jgi:hypothetical protein
MPITTPSAPQSITAVTLNVTSAGTPATVSQTFNDPATLASLKLGQNSLPITNQAILGRYATPGLQCSNTLSVEYTGYMDVNSVTVATPALVSNFVATPITLSNFGPFNLDYVSGGTFTLSPPTSNSNSPGAFTYSVPANNGVVSISGNVVTMLAAGSTTITAIQAAAGGYASSTPITASLNVVFVPPAPSLSNFTVPAKKIGDAPFNITAPTSNSNGSFSYTSSNNNVATIGLPGINWASRTSPVDRNYWLSVAYGNGLFVTVANGGTGNRVMTSSNGINWTIRNSAADNSWRSVAYGNGLWVAVSSNGIGNRRVMTSPDGITWTIRTGAANNSWRSVAYGNGLWVAVAWSGSGNNVMTSPDGINWTLRTSAADYLWNSVAYGNGLWVAVTVSGVINSVMTSPDGITWTIRTSSADNSWRSVAYGNGLWVAVASYGTGTGNRVMTSPDGITWTSRTSAADNAWYSVAYGNGLWVAVSTEDSGNGRVMTSPDGITWTLRTNAPGNFWRSVAYGNGLFVAVATDDFGSGGVMTSGDSINIDGLGSSIITATQAATNNYSSGMISATFTVT